MIEHRGYYLQMLRAKSYGLVRRLARRTSSSHRLLVPYVAGKCGLEIGGPSRIFRKQGSMPVYNLCRAIDSCNFSDTTIWSGSGGFEQFKAPLRSRYFAEASELSPLPDHAYQFVLASHVLEHVANPLRALREWRRVLAPGGALLIIVPDKCHTFDHKRLYTPFDHLAADFVANTSEDDLTHMPEILAHHDLGLDQPGETWAHFESRCRENYRLRSMHHHVFSPDTLGRALEFAGLNVICLSVEQPIHIVALAQKEAARNREKEEEENVW